MIVQQQKKNIHDVWASSNGKEMRHLCYFNQPKHQDVYPCFSITLLFRSLIINCVLGLVLITIGSIPYKFLRSLAISTHHNIEFLPLKKSLYRHIFLYLCISRYVHLSVNNNFLPTCIMKRHKLLLLITCTFSSFPSMVVVSNPYFNSIITPHSLK